MLLIATESKAPTIACITKVIPVSQESFCWLLVLKLCD